MITPDHKEHASLESWVEEEFKSHGWSTIELTYHAHVDDSNKNRLARNVSFGAWLVRTRSDRISFSDTELWKWDCKTSTWDTGKDFAIEIMPLLTMYRDSELGCNCVFFCQRSNGMNYAFSPTELFGHVARIIIPTKRRNQKIIDNLIDWCTRHVGGTVNIVTSDKVVGSGDPFAAIAIDEIPHRSITDFFNLLS